MRSQGWLLPTLVGAALTVAATAIAQPKPDPGQREFDAKCAVCHGLDGKGKGPYAEQLKGSLPDLTTMAKILAGGLPGGCVAGRADVLAYIAPGEVVVDPFVEHAPMSQLNDLLDKMAHHQLTKRMVLDPRR